MNKKYLPIGTICTLKGENKKLMIIGYFSTKYNGSISIKDYCGYNYPEGLLSNIKYQFNHSQIDIIHHLGYTSEEFEKLNQKLNKINNPPTKDVTDSNTFFKDIKFNENGVVTFEEPIINNYVQKTAKISIKTNEKDQHSTTDNSFFKKNSIPSNIIENVENYQNWSIFKSIKFDENGTVIEAIEKNSNTNSND